VVYEVIRPWVVVPGACGGRPDRVARVHDVSQEPVRSSTSETLTLPVVRSGTDQTAPRARDGDRGCGRGTSQRYGDHLHSAADEPGR
jgi:hypothetical protein